MTFPQNAFFRVRNLTPPCPWTNPAQAARAAAERAAERAGAARKRAEQLARDRTEREEQLRTKEEEQRALLSGSESQVPPLPSPPLLLPLPVSLLYTPTPPRRASGRRSDDVVRTRVFADAGVC